MWVLHRKHPKLMTIRFQIQNSITEYRTYFDLRCSETSTKLFPRKFQQK